MSPTRASYDSPEALARFEGRVPQMLEALAALTDIESPSSSFEALGVCGGYLAAMGTNLLGKPPQRIEVDGRVHLLWCFGETPRIVLVGHYDTVHPLGTILRFPFSVDGDIARGPGVCDMKGGVVIALHALHDLVAVQGASALDGVCLLVNADEEIGSPTSHSLILELAESAKFVIGFENAGSSGQIKTSRRGCSHYKISVKGRAAHAGDGAEKGINALRDMCRLMEPVCQLAAPELGTSVTPTMASAGDTSNTVPELATMVVDVRCESAAEQMRVDSALRALTESRFESMVEVSGGIEQPPLPDEASARLFAMTADVAQALGMSAPVPMAVGGSADSCKFAGAGTEAIDGFGAIGGDDHSDREWIYVSSLPRQAALAAGLVNELLQRRPDVG